MRALLPSLVGGAVALGLGVPVGAAQVCTGAPLARGEWYAAAAAGYAIYDFRGMVEATDLGVEVRALPFGGTGLSGGYTHRSMARSAIPVHVLWSGFSARLPFFQRAELCAHGNPAAALTSDEATETEYINVSVPLGVSVALSFMLREAVVVIPYIAPTLIQSRLSGRVLGVEVVEADTGVGAEFGVGARLGRWAGRVGIRLTSLDPAVGTAAYPHRSFQFTAGLVF